MASIFSRTCIVVPDAKKAADFYHQVFGWEIMIDTSYRGSYHFPPIVKGDENTEFMVIYLRSTSHNEEGIGFLSYVNPPFDTAIKTNRSTINMGETVLVVTTDDIDGVFKRAKELNANIVNEPREWKGQSLEGEGVSLKMMSIFDPNGTYIEINNP